MDSVTYELGLSSLYVVQTRQRVVEERRALLKKLAYGEPVVYWNINDGGG